MPTDKPRLTQTHIAGTSNIVALIVILIYEKYKI